MALGQQEEICGSIPNIQEIVRRLTDYNLLKDLDEVKDQRIANLEKENELLKREVELNNRIIAIKDMEIAAQKRAFEDMKEVTDRALKLAETKKSSNIWYIIGGILAAFCIGLAIGL